MGRVHPRAVGSTARTDDGHWGAWRAVVALPAMGAGVGVMLVVLGFLGRWEGLGLFVWIVAGLLTLSRAGERLVVRLAFGFRRLSREERDLLEPVWAHALARCAVSGGSVDLYVQRSDVVNAYATGGCSVAVTSRVVAGYQSGRLDAVLVEAVVAHELGHHVTRATRFTLVTLWLSMPWHVFRWSVLRICGRLVGVQPIGLEFGVAGAAFTMAITQAVEHHVWSTALVLGAVAVFSILTPLADAAISRSSERGADQFAAQMGYRDDLVQSLMILDPADSLRRKHLFQLLKRHPSTAQRIDELRRLTTQSDLLCGRAEKEAMSGSWVG